MVSWQKKKLVKNENNTGASQHGRTLCITRPHDAIGEKRKIIIRRRVCSNFGWLGRGSVDKLKPQPSTDDDDYYSAADSISSDENIEDDEIPPPAGSEGDDKQLEGLQKKLQQQEKEVRILECPP